LTEPGALDREEAVDQRLVDLIKQCWSEDEHLRPTAGAALNRFIGISRIR
jgi:hypothetical protein